MVRIWGKGRRHGERADGDGGTNGVSHGTHRVRVSVTWLLLAVVTVAALCVGLCAVLLPDRAPALLQAAGEVTDAPVSVQEYTGSAQVSVIPTVSASRQVLAHTAGTVTADWSQGRLESGRKALSVDGRVVVALHTATPLYRDLKAGDQGDDVRALNDELNRLGYASSPGSAVFSPATARGWAQLLKDAGDPNADGSLSLADVAWIPQPAVTVSGWAGAPGSVIADGDPLGEVPGSIERVDLKGGEASGFDRTLTVFGQTVTLPAGQTGTDDADFCARLTATQDFQALLAQGKAVDWSQGVDGTVALTAPLQVWRVPAAAVFGAKDGTTGCVAARKGTTVPVRIVGSQLGVSLVQPTDGTALDAVRQVALGSAIAGASCS